MCGINAIIEIQPDRLGLRSFFDPDEGKTGKIYAGRDRFIARHGLLRVILSRYLNLQPGKLVFSYNPQGKPQLVSPADHNIPCFSMSHSNGLALYAITRSREIGIDVEYIRAISNAALIAKNYFFPREQALMDSLPRDLSERMFFHLWKVKEAYCKATSEGIAGPGAH